MQTFSETLSDKIMGYTRVFIWSYTTRWPAWPAYIATIMSPVQLLHPRHAPNGVIV